MKKLLILLLCFGAYKLWSDYGGGGPSGQLSAHDEVIMYSLTTCGYCRQKADQLDAAGIEYVEYFIDSDSRRKDELTNKLKQAGFAPRAWGTPILDVHGTMLPNNPSLEKIRQHL
jgi:glutaredoxin